MKSITTLLLIAASSAFVSCAQTPSFGEQIQAEGSNVANIGEKWSQGEKMKLKGEKLINNGEELQEEGRKMNKKGAKLVEKGQLMMTEAKAEYALTSANPASAPTMKTQ